MTVTTGVPPGYSHDWTTGLPDPATTRLQVGQVVVNMEDPTDRGVVIRSRGGKPGDPAPLPAMTPMDHVIERGVGFHTVTTNGDGKWRPIPWEDQTPEERSLSASLEWVPRPPDDTEPEDYDSHLWAVMENLLTPAERDRLWDWGGDAPSARDLFHAISQRMTP